MEKQALLISPLVHTLDYGEGECSPGGWVSYVISLREPGTEDIDHLILEPFTVDAAGP